MIKLDLGPESGGGKHPLKASQHLVNLKTLDHAKHAQIHAEASLNLKEEIRAQTHTPDKIQIVGPREIRKRGLGKWPMFVASVIVMFVLNLGQIVFLGKTRGEEALALASEGFSTLQEAGETLLSGEPTAGATLFEQAEDLFEQAQSRGSFLLNAPTLGLDEPTPVNSLRNMIEAGKLMTAVGTHISEAKEKWNTWQASPEKVESLSEFLQGLSREHLHPASEDLKKINALLRDVDVTGTGYEQKLASAQEKLAALSTLLELWVEAEPALWTALGDYTPQRYLVLLENDDEMRQGGGFIGNFALVDLNEGTLTGMEFHDVYEFDGLYHEDLPVPVQELENLTDVWRMRDSNISADFPISAEKAAWFLEQEGGPGVDGVISLKLSAVEALLKDLGPLTVPSFKTPLEGENLGPILSAFIESKTLPKTVLEELGNALHEQLNNRDQLTHLGLQAWEQVLRKKILFYHKDPLVESTFHALGVDGDLPDFNTLEGDFFMMTATNRGGNKTDRYIETQVSHDTQILEDQTMIDTITLSRSNTVSRDRLQALKSRLEGMGFTAWDDAVEWVLGLSPNFTGLRFYLPEGARLLETTGIYRDEVQFYYDPFLDHPYFYLDQILEPGESQTLTLKFELPNKFSSDFKELSFKHFVQPGLDGQFTKTLTAPENTVYSSNPWPTQNKAEKDYFYTGEFRGDQTWTFLVR